MSQLLMSRPGARPFMAAPSPSMVRVTENMVRVTPSRRTLDSRFPTLCFFVETGRLPLFEVLLTTDRGLFDTARAGERMSSIFYSSREDAGLLPTDEGRGAYHVPPAVLNSFAQHNPDATALYYTAIAYATAEGAGARFAHPPETLSQTAPSIMLVKGFAGQSLSRVLGVAAHRLRTLGLNGKVEPGAAGGMIAGPGGLPIRAPAKQHMPSPVPARPGPGPMQPEPEKPTPPVGAEPVPSYPDEGEDGAEAGAGQGNGGVGNGATARGGPATGNGGQRPSPHQGNGTGNGKRNDRPSLHPNGGNGGRGAGAAPAEPDFEYSDGYDDVDEDEIEAAGPPRPSADDDTYGDDDVGIPPGTGGARNGRQGNGQAPAIDAANRTGDGNGSGRRAAMAAPPGSDPDRGMSGDYDELDPVEGVIQQSLDRPFEAPAGASVGEGGAEGETGPLTADIKRQIIERVTNLESGRTRHDAINPDGEFKGRFGREDPHFQKAHRGLSYGIAGFNQDDGTLGQLLVLMRDRDPTAFENTFGPDAALMLQTVTAPGPRSIEAEDGRSTRVQKVAGADLWEEPWVSRFRTAAEYPAFQAAQNQLTAELYLDPVLPYADWLGIASERGIAILFDRAMQMGVAPGMKIVVDAVGPIKTEAQRAAALDALFAPGEDATLEAFQELAGITRTGEWNPESHAALIGALRDLDDQGEEIPLEILGYDEVLDTLVMASASKFWADRVLRLRVQENISDVLFTP